MEFINKTSLTINGLAGSDEINLNNPNTPTGLTGITVNGGDPTASDTLVVNGTTGSDAIGYKPTGIGAGSVTVNRLAHRDLHGYRGTYDQRARRGGRAHADDARQMSDVDELTYTPALRRTRARSPVATPSAAWLLSPSRLSISGLRGA